MTYALIVTCAFWLTLVVAVALAFKVAELREQRDDAVNRMLDFVQKQGSCSQRTGHIRGAVCFDNVEHLAWIREKVRR